MESPTNYARGKAKYIRIKPTARIETKEVLGDLAIVMDVQSRLKGHTSARPKESMTSLKNSSYVDIKSSIRNPYDSIESGKKAVNAEKDGE